MACCHDSCCPSTPARQEMNSPRWHRALWIALLVNAGRGAVYSFVVPHHPQVPAFEYPYVVVLVELEEGTRLVSNVVGVEPAEVYVGMPVAVEFVAVDDELTLPMFRVAG